MNEEAVRASDELESAAADLETAGRPVIVSESVLAEPVRAAVDAVRELASDLAESGRYGSE
ncbi:hypothetical protein [Saccharopolyspora sp. 6M]|uniref:hypothetical protein n=1 Tax=Saccharopolyspora sp. 6M TaxID=2877237 RepID=UPI001CD448DA|nr:hypothetical protein [Saccharopolyspora sp. 6M]MCA1229951.1 hypothetical protein [Saccharopolyspora sp. 6M]